MIKQYVEKLADGTLLTAESREELQQKKADLGLVVAKEKPVVKEAKKAEEKPEAPSAEEPAELPDLKKLKKDELIDLAGRLGLEDKVHYKNTVAELIEIIEKHTEE